jgi:hypothetical protein
MLDRIEHHENPCITVPSTAALDAGFKARDERKLAAVRAARDRQRVCACGKPFVSTRANHIACSRRCSQRLRRDGRRLALERAKRAATFQCHGDAGLRT